jgi:hypothetical protein
MKLSGGTILLILLALALICAMVLTLWLGGNRSRHGFSSHQHAVPLTTPVIAQADGEICQPIQKPAATTGGFPLFLEPVRIL